MDHSFKKLKEWDKPLLDAPGNVHAGHVFLEHVLLDAHAHVLCTAVNKKPNQKGGETTVAQGRQSYRHMSANATCSCQCRILFGLAGAMISDDDYKKTFLTNEIRVQN